jgi:5-methylcytosine-specific restriction protein A
VYLYRHPLCVNCHDQGYLEPATVVDHIQPHRGDQALFWDPSNWQALCKTCHDRKTAQEVNARRE